MTERSRPQPRVQPGSTQAERTVAVFVVLAAVAILLGGCGGSSNAPAQPSAVVRARLPCLSAPAVNVRRALDLASDRTMFAACEQQLRGQLGALARRIDDGQMRAVFATAVAHRFAPYGAARGVSIAALRRARVLDCDNYAALVFWIYRNLGGDVRRPRFLGWDGGALGNHAQIWVGDLMLDPTAGLVAWIPLREALAGRSPDQIVDLSVRPGPDGFREKVRRALAGGELRPQDIIYDFGVARFMGGAVGRRAARALN